MAIKIPSKNIYEINNPKIRDNLIDNVSVEQIVVTPNKEYRKVIQTKEFDIKIEDFKTKTNDKLEGRFWTPSNASPNWGDGIAYSEIKAFYYSNKIEISKDLIKNNIITKLYEKKDDNGNSNIGYSIAYDKYDGISTATYSVVNAETITYRIYDINNKYNDTPTKSHIGKIESLKVETTNDLKALGISAPFKAIAELVDETNLSTLSINEYENYFEFDFNVLVGKEEVSITGYSENGENNNASGTCIKYIPKQLEITIYGDTIGIDLTDGSVTYGGVNKPHSLSGNELLQDSAYKKTNAILNITNIVETTSNINYYKVYFGNENINGELNYDLPIYIQGDNVNSYSLDSDILGHFIKATKGIFPTFKVGDTINVFQKKPLTKIIAENVLRQYANGKETATLLCDIADYYNENGDKVIDIKTDKMSFCLHNEVIPMIYGADGKDYAMSTYQDGSSKVFEVTGIKIFYDGAVWQELSLLEINK